jgi:hypothetical protein
MGDISRGKAGLRPLVIALAVGLAIVCFATLAVSIHHWPP